MVKRERLLEKIEEKKEFKRQIKQNLELTHAQIKNLHEQDEEIDLEIALLENHLKKMDG